MSNSNFDALLTLLKANLFGEPVYQNPQSQLIIVIISREKILDR